jgi:hypothetical protein
MTIVLGMHATKHFGNTDTLLLLHYLINLGNGAILISFMDSLRFRRKAGAKGIEWGHSYSMLDTTTKEAVAFAFVAAVSLYLNVLLLAYTSYRYSPYTIYRSSGYWICLSYYFHRDT